MLPAFMFMFLSKRKRVEQIKLHWNAMSDAEVKEVYQDDVRWLCTLKGLYGDDFSTTKLVIKFKKHLNKRVIPQMKRRGFDCYYEIKER